MAKQIVNTGSSANSRDGDSLRAAFTKINANFDELYAKDATDVDLSVVSESIIPDTDNTYDLGSADKQWRSLYVSSDTIFIGGVSLKIDGDNRLIVGDDSTVLGGAVSYTDLTDRPTIPTDLSDLTDTENLLGSGGADTGDITIDGVKIQGAGTASGDGNGYSTIELVPDTDLYNNDQYLIIDPTDPQHIHIRAGGTIDNSAAELYLGGELNYVRVVDDTGVRLQNRTRNDTFYSFVAPTDFNTATWYESAGTYFVQYTAVDPEIGDLAFTFGDDDENTVTLTLANEETYTLTYGGSASNLGSGVYRFSVDQAPPVSPSTITAIDFEIWTSQTNFLTLSSNDFEVSVTDDLRLTGNDTVSLRNRSTTDPVTIITNYNNAAQTWQFGADGVLTLPGTGTIRTTFGAMSINAPTGSSNLSIKSNDATTYMIVGNGAAGVTVGTYNWQFSNTGNLTFPNNTVQTTAWAGIPGPYADDSAAATAGVPVGYPYHKTGTSGQVFVRLS